MPHETTWNHEVLRCSSLHTVLVRKSLRGTYIYGWLWFYRCWLLDGGIGNWNSMCNFCGGPGSVHLFHEILRIESWHVPVTCLTDQMCPLVSSIGLGWLHNLTIVVPDDISTSTVGSSCWTGCLGLSCERDKTEMVEGAALLLHEHACHWLPGHGCFHELAEWCSGECLHCKSLGRLKSV